MLKPATKHTRWGEPHQNSNPPMLETGSAWLDNRGLKLKFIAAAVCMFLAYALAGGVIESTGLRKPRMTDARDPDAERNCYAPHLPLEKRAACIVARDDAREVERKARREKEAAERAAKQAQDKALDDEIERRRAKLKYEKSRAEFGQRVSGVLLAR